MITHALSYHSPLEPRWPLLSHVTSFTDSLPGSARHGGSSDRGAPSPRQAPLRGLSAPGTTAREAAHTEAALPTACQRHRGPHNRAPRSPARHPLVPGRAGPRRAASSRPALPGSLPPAPRAVRRGVGPAAPDRLAGSGEDGERHCRGGEGGAAAPRSGSSYPNLPPTAPPS